MRHKLEFDDARGIYMCEVCGTAFTQDALVAEMDAHGCPGPKADEGKSSKWTTAQDIIDKYNNASWFFTWSRIDFDKDDLPTGTIDPAFSYTITPSNPDKEGWFVHYEDAEAKGRRLVKSAGYMNDDEGV